MSGRDRNQREALISEYLNDSRQGLNTQFSLADLLRQSVYSRLAGYEDLNDAVRVSADPTFRLIGSPKRWDRGAALTSTLHWFETELLTHEENLVGLRAVNRELRAQAEMATRADRIVLDMDSSESPVHGAQEGSAYNGHFASVCYPPLFLFNDQGDCLAASLRPGNVPSADDWDDLLEQGVRAARHWVRRRGLAGVGEPRIGVAAGVVDAVKAASRGRSQRFGHRLDRDDPHPPGPAALAFRDAVDLGEDALHLLGTVTGLRHDGG